MPSENADDGRRPATHRSAAPWDPARRSGPGAARRRRHRPAQRGRPCQGSRRADQAWRLQCRRSGRAAPRGRPHRRDACAAGAAPGRRFPPRPGRAAAPAPGGRSRMVGGAGAAGREDPYTVRNRARWSGVIACHGAAEGTGRHLGMERLTDRRDGGCADGRDKSR